MSSQPLSPGNNSNANTKIKGNVTHVNNLNIGKVKQSSITTYNQKRMMKQSIESVKNSSNIGSPKNVLTYQMSNNRFRESIEKDSMESQERLV